MSRRRTVVVAVWVLTLGLLGGAAWAGLRWHDAAQDPRLESARVRDVVLARAERIAVDLSTLDYHHPEDAVARWGAAATGELYQSLQDGKGSYQQLITAGEVSTTATSVDAAVQSLSADRTEAVVLVGLDVTVTPSSAAPTVQHERLVVTLKRTDGVWKASAMEPVVS